MYPESPLITGTHDDNNNDNNNSNNNNDNKPYIKREVRHVKKVSANILKAVNEIVSG